MIDEWSHDRTGWARFSDDRKFRYRLARSITALGHSWMTLNASARTWGGFEEFEPSRILFLMLNPSTADAFKLDPTVQRCVKFAQRWGGDVLEVVNLFALRSPWPDDVWAATDRGDGPENDSAIVAACGDASRVIAAWGANGWRYGRAAFVRERLDKASVKLEALAFSAGHPRHPLARGKHRISDDAEPTPYEWRAA